MVRSTRLDAAFLERLGEAVATMRVPQRGIALVPLVRLAPHVPAGRTVIVDGGASHRLGAPIVVLDHAEPPACAGQGDGLTRRESEVATLVAQGLANKQIARQLGISLGTVKDHVHAILSKCGVANRAALARRFAVMTR